MIRHQFFSTEKVVELEPQGPLSVKDFRDLDEMVQQERSHGRMPCGIVVAAAEFPGWRDLDALAAHVEFIRENHKFLRRIAIVSEDISLRIFVEKCIAPLIRPEVRFFAMNDIAGAGKWVAAAE